MTAHPDRNGRTLVEMVCGELRQMISAEGLTVGDRLPSEARIAEIHGVSRTVVREAIAALRADGLVEARRGAGVFLTAPTTTPKGAFQNVDHARISSTIDLLELRAAVESRGAMLAAIRRSPAQEEAIFRCHEEVGRCIAAHISTVDADFALHSAIAAATNNPRFTEFMALLGVNGIPRASLHLPLQPDLMAQLHAEHERIVNAISHRDEGAAQRAMEEHLVGSQRRYQQLLRERSARKTAEPVDN